MGNPVPAYLAQPSRSMPGLSCLSPLHCSVHSMAASGMSTFESTPRLSNYFQTFMILFDFQKIFIFSEHICTLLRYFQTSRNPLKKNQNGAKLERVNVHTGMKSYLSGKSKCEDRITSYMYMCRVFSAGEAMRPNMSRRKPN